jgi:hypothetical protein
VATACGSSSGPGTANTWQWLQKQFHVSNLAFLEIWMVLAVFGSVSWINMLNIHI